jgi:hypothetical protein
MIIRGAAFFLSLIVSISGAAAQEKNASPLPAHLPLLKEACFGRVYDAAHLASHPKQRVTSFHLAREFTPDPLTEDNSWTVENLRDADGEDGRIMVTAYVRFRDKPGVFSNGLSCLRNDKGLVRCGIDCDGGSFNLKAGGTSILLENEGFVVVGGCGASEEDQDNLEIVKPGADDKLFRLDPKPVAACIAERQARAPAFAKLGAPIRERLAAKGEVCFSREYDAAHLTAHPAQTVRRIAVLKSADDVRAPGEHPSYDLVFRMIRKDGERFEKKASCAPDAYRYLCSFHNEDSNAHGEFYLTRAGVTDISLRDRKERLTDFFHANLGKDDRFFKLRGGAAKDCAF